MSSLSDLVVLVKGGGEAASGVAHRLHRAGFNAFRKPYTKKQRP